MPKVKSRKKLSTTALFKQLKFDKSLLIVIIAVVVATGGYLLYKDTIASEKPPGKYYLPSTWSGFMATSSDKVKGIVHCPGYRLSLYGNTSYCYQINPSNPSAFRMGYSNFSTSLFAKSTDWTHAGSALGVIPGDLKACPNGSWFVRQVVGAPSAYGLADYGATLTKVSSIWQFKPAIFYAGKCIVTGQAINVTN